MRYARVDLGEPTHAALENSGVVVPGMQAGLQLRNRVLTRVDRAGELVDLACRCRQKAVEPRDLLLGAASLTLSFCAGFDRNSLELLDTLVACIHFSDCLIAAGDRTRDVLPQPRRRRAFVFEPARELFIRDFARCELRFELFEAALEIHRLVRKFVARSRLGHRRRQRFRQATFGSIELVAVIGELIVQGRPALLATLDMGFELFDTRTKTGRAPNLVLVEPLSAGRGFGVAIGGIAESRDFLEQLFAIGFRAGGDLPRFL